MAAETDGGAIERPRPHVGVVILHWGLPEVTARCLQSISRTSYAPKTVFLVDNTQKLDEAIVGHASPTSVEILRPPRNLGFAEGSSSGIRAALQAGVDYILLLNNDVVVEPGFLDHLVRAAQGAARVGLVSPQITFLDRPERVWYAGGEFSLWGRMPRHTRWRRRLDTGRPPAEVAFATGCVMLIHPQVVRTVGPFDARFFAYCEDLDFSLRARQAGFRILMVPASVVRHAATYDERHLALRVYYSTRNLLEVVRKHASWYQWPTFALSFMVTWIGFFSVLAYGRWQPRILTALARGIQDFVRGRLGERAL